MPFVNIDLTPGRTPEKKEELIKNVTDAVANTLQVSKDRIFVIIHELPRENFGFAGTQLSKMP